MRFPSANGRAATNLAGRLVNVYCIDKLATKLVQVLVAHIVINSDNSSFE